MPFQPPGQTRAEAIAAKAPQLVADIWLYPHFKVADLVLLRGVVAARGAEGSGHRRRVGWRTPVYGSSSDCCSNRQLAPGIDLPIFLNSDHTHSLADAKEAAKCGFDSIVFDRSALPFEENIRETRQAVEELKGINPSIFAEGEIGDVGTRGVHFRLSGTCLELAARVAQFSTAG